MRVRTAVAITVGIITAQAVAAWFAEKAWFTLPDRQWPPARWHLELGNVSEALAAFAGALAALIALRIAGRDRRERRNERRREEATAARLIRLSVKPEGNRAGANVTVRNFGHLSVLDMTVSGAQWSQRPGALVEITTPERPALRRGMPVLRPWSGEGMDGAEEVTYAVEFLDPESRRPLVPVIGDRPHGPIVDIDLSTVVVTIQFTTADGTRWETPTDGDGTGEPRRV